jgi:hypothetical protein
MRKQSLVVSRQLLVLSVALALLLSAQGAFATKPHPNFGESTKVGARAYTKQNTHEALTVEEAEFLKDKVEYNAIQTKLWPLCTERKTDVAPDCKSLSAEELKASYPDPSIGGLGARYSVSKEQAEVLMQRRSQLEKKWLGK